MRAKPSWHSHAAELHNAGLSYSEIGRQLGRTPSAVWKIINREQTQAWSRKSNQDPHRKAAKRAWDRANRRQTSTARRDNDPGVPGLLPIYRREHGQMVIVDFARVDIADWDALNGRAFFFTAGYAATSIDGRQAYLHHLVLPKQPGLVNDHINRDKLDNRRSNLRQVTQRENCANRGGIFERQAA